MEETQFPYKAIQGKSFVRSTLVLVAFVGNDANRDHPPFFSYSCFSKEVNREAHLASLAPLTDSLCRNILREWKC